MASVCDIELVKKLGKNKAQLVIDEFNQFVKDNNLTESTEITGKLNDLLEQKSKKIIMSKQEQLITKIKSTELQKTIWDQDVNKIRQKFDDVLEATDDKIAATRQGFNIALSDISNDAFAKRFADDGFQFQVFKRLSDNIPSKDEAVEMAAMAYRKGFNYLYKAKQSVGLQLDALQSYAGKQMHSAVKIVADSDGWTRFATENFDFNAMGIDPKNIDKFIGDMFKRAKSPKYLIDGEFTEIQFGSVAGMQEARVIKFRTIEAEYQYMKQFGGGSFTDNAIKTMERESQVVGLSSTLGPRHEATFAEAQSFMAQAGVNKSELINSKKTYDNMRGANPYGRPQSVAGNAGVMLRKFNDMNKLSAMSSISTVTDIPFMAGVAEALLGGGVKGYSRNLVKFTTDMVNNFRPYGKDVAAKWANRMGVYLEEINPLLDRHAMRDYMEAGKSFMSYDKAHRFFMSATGLPRQNWSAKIAASKLFSHGLADMSGQALDTLPKKTQEMFASLGITGKSWDSIRANALEDIDGDGYLSPAKLFEDGFTEDGIKLAAFLKGASEMGSPTQSAKFRAEKASFDPDSIFGIINLSIAQFKSFPISVYNTTKVIAGSSNPYANLAATAAISTALGASVIQMRTYAKKGDFRKVDGKFALDSLAQGGAGGLLGDFFAADYSTKWRTLQGDILGPSVGTVADVMYMGSKIKNKALGTGSAPTTKEWGRFVWYNTPSMIYAPATYKYFEKFLKEF